MLDQGQDPNTLPAGDVEYDVVEAGRVEVGQWVRTDYGPRWFQVTRAIDAGAGWVALHFSDPLVVMSVEADTYVPVCG